MIITIISILTLLLLIALYTISNLLKKVEKYEEDILLKEEFIQKFDSLVKNGHSKIKQLDSLGAFESDDEVGTFFKNLKDLSFTLDAYFKNYQEEPSEEEKTK
jgi:hypothetical protein